MRTMIVLMLINLVVWIPLIILFVLAVKALRKYLKSADVRREKKTVQKTLGEVIKDHRIRCKMTQEFVAETVGVSRQAVSKWENGASDPSTSNLFALAKLFGISAEALLKDVSNPTDKE